MYGDFYHFDYSINTTSLEEGSFTREIAWTKPLRPTEKNEDYDVVESGATIWQVEEQETITQNSTDPILLSTVDGRTDWASIKTKYFIASIIPENKGIYGSFKSENQLFGERKVTPGYKIYIGHNFLNKFGYILKKERIIFDNVLIVLDNKVPELFINKIIKTIKCKNKILFKFKSTEKNKNLNKVNKIINLLLKNNFNRNDCIIGLGGGIVGDLSCYVASIYKRGLKFINIPTTLLAQVDASVGGKSGVNHKNFGKNLIGTIYQPSIVLTDTCFLESLKKREIVCGYAEVFKHTLIRDKKAFSYLNKFTKEILDLKKPFINNVIHKSCLIKKRVVEEDENEKNIRKILNLGHTFGHAFEASYNFRNNLNHGEGVLLLSLIHI